MGYCLVAHVVRFDQEAAEPVHDHDAVSTWSVPLGSGSGPSHVYVLHIHPGGSIGPHETGFGQLFICDCR